MNIARLRAGGLIVALLGALLIGCRTPPPAPVPGTPGFCADWFHLADEAAKLSAGQTGRPASGEIRASVEATAAYLKALSSSAPPELRSDFNTYAQWWSAFADAMARVDYDFTRIPGDPGLQQAMRQASEPAFTQASTHITSWVQEHCTAGR